MILYNLHHTFLIDGEELIQDPNTNKETIINPIFDLVAKLKIVEHEEEGKSLEEDHAEPLDIVKETKEEKLKMIVIGEAQNIIDKLREIGHE